MQLMFACGFPPGLEYLIYATLGLWAVAALAVLVNCIASLKAPNERRALEFSLWFCFLALGGLGWYPLKLTGDLGILPWLSYIYGAPTLILAHSARLYVLARREKVLTQATEDAPESTVSPGADGADELSLALIPQNYTLRNT